jgi:putative oxidoreductase
MTMSTSVSPVSIAPAGTVSQSGVFHAAVHLLGRLALAALFLPAGLNKISGFDGTVGYIQSVGLPFAALGAVLAILIEVVGGLALVAGYRTRVAALVLAGFTLVASVFFHAYWAAPADQAFMQQLMFFKNLGVIGGLLVLAAAAPGPWSVDGRR